MQLHDRRAFSHDGRFAILARQVERGEESADLRRESSVGRGEVVEGEADVRERESRGRGDELLEERSEGLGGVEA